MICTQTRPCPAALRAVTMALLALIGLLQLGCTASSEYMREVAPTPLQASPEAALVVFVRPSSFASGIKTTILDGRGRFLGDSLPESYFAVKVPPGQHVFIAWAENTAALQASLAPGRVYYVEVSPKPGAFSARMHLLAITPRTESWGELQEWLADSKRLDPDQAGGQAYLASRHEDVAERIRRADEILREYDAEELGERTIRPEDGR